MSFISRAYSAGDNNAPRASRAADAPAMGVFFDTDTGKFRVPMPAQKRAHNAPATAPREAPREKAQVTHRHGMTFIRLPPSSRMREQAHLGPDGEIRVGHEQSPRE